MSPDGEEIELRLSTLPTAFGEKMVMRIFDPEVLVRDFDELGFSAEDNERWQRDDDASPTASSWSPARPARARRPRSTRRSSSSPTPEVNVCTIEDPIEMVEPAFNQMQVQHKIGVDFADGVRALLRQDPTSSWSARSATSRPRRWRSRPR